MRIGSPPAYAASVRAANKMLEGAAWWENRDLITVLAPQVQVKGGVGTGGRLHGRVERGPNDKSARYCSAFCNKSARRQPARCSSSRTTLADQS